MKVKFLLPLSYAKLEHVDGRSSVAQADRLCHTVRYAVLQPIHSVCYAIHMLLHATQCYPHAIAACQRLYSVHSIAHTVAGSNRLL